MPAWLPAGLLSGSLLIDRKEAATLAHKSKLMRIMVQSWVVSFGFRADTPQPTGVDLRYAERPYTCENLLPPTYG